VTRQGSCPCGAVRFSIDGPVRDVIVCHCEACREANGGEPWEASAAYRRDLVVDASTLCWERAAVSEHDARRGFCRRCSAYVLWDAPARETVSFSAAALGEDGRDLEVAAHIWLGDGQGLPESVRANWHDGTPASG